MHSQTAQEELEGSFRRLDEENARLSAQLLDKSSQLVLEVCGVLMCRMSIPTHTHGQIRIQQSCTYTEYYSTWR